MEGSKQEDWWLGDYPNYSLRRYKDMPVYQRFSSSVRPFSKILEKYREAFWRDDNCFIFEWYDSKLQKGEKFGLDHNSTTYFYEHWYYEEDIHIVEKSWLCEPIEWGVVIKYYPEYEEEVSWSTEEGKKVVETKKRLPEKVEGIKKGTVLTPDGLEDFTEVFWESPTGFGKEKKWTRGTAKGEENEYKDGDNRWGNSWDEDANQHSKKEWHEEGNHKWGEREGKEGYEEFKEKWDKNSEGSFEEIDYLDRGQEYGKTRVRSKSHSYNVEWEGKKPEIIVPGSEEDEQNEPGQEGKKKPIGGMKKPQGTKLRSSRPGDKTPDAEDKTPDDKDKLLLRSTTSERPQVSDVEKFGLQLSNLFKELKGDLQDKLEEIKNNDASKSIYPELIEVAEELKSVKDPAVLDPQGALAALQTLRDLDKKINSAEKHLISSQPSLDQLNNLFNETYATASSLVPVLDPSNLSDSHHELQNLSREFDSTTTPKDKIRLIGAINPKIQDMVRASKKKVEDSAKEIAEMSQKLEGLLKNFEDAMRQSQQTLQDIEKNFKPNDETVMPICNAYMARAKEVIQDVEKAAPYHQTMPQISSILVDMEKFKREIMGDDLNKKLEGLVNSVQALNNDMAENLQGSVAKEPTTQPESLKEKIDQLEKDLAKANALANKLMGKDVQTGDPELDAIKAHNPEEGKLPIDPIELLKDFWVQGKQEQDLTNKALQTLVDSLGTEDEKHQAAELADAGQKAVSGIAPEDPRGAVEQLKQSLDEYLPVKIHSAELLSNLADKAAAKAKEAEVKPETIENLWKALMISEKIAEKLLHGDPPAGLDELKKTIDALPAKPNVEDMHKALVKYQEINLALANGDEEATAEDLKDAEASAKRRAGGQGKAKGGLAKKGKRALRSGRGAKKIDFTEPTVEALESSFKTSNELALWVWGSKPKVLRHLDELKQEKEEILKLIKENLQAEETQDKFLAFLKKLEDEKQGIYMNSDTPKNLLLIQKKCEKVLETASKLINTQVPNEVEALKSSKTPESLSDYTKAVGFLLSFFFKMVKDATGVDEGGDNLEEAMSALKKKQVISLLPFDPMVLLDELKGKSDTDLKRLKFLTGLVGSEEDVKENDELEEKANALLKDINPQSPQEAVELIDTYLSAYPAVGKDIAGKTENFMSVLLSKLTDPEPMERDVNALIESCERLFAAIQKLSENVVTPPEYDSLKSRKDELPTSPKELVPYLASLAKDMSVTNLNLLSTALDLPMTKEDDHKIISEVNRKVKAAPVQVLRDIQHLFSGPGLEDMLAVIIRLHKASEYFVDTLSVSDPALFGKCNEKYLSLESLTPLEVKALGKDFSDLMLSFVADSEDFFTQTEDEEKTLFARRRDIKAQSTILWDDIFKSRGLDLDSGLYCEHINEEQEFAVVYLEAIPPVVGSQDQKSQAKFLIERSREILAEVDEKSKIENYIQLRLEESRLISSLCNKLQNMSERLAQLDKERENIMALTISEVTILVEQNNPELKNQLEMIVGKEEEYKNREVENSIDLFMRLTNRLALEKELQRIKEEAKPRDNSEAELIKSLSELELKLYQELKGLNSALGDISQELSTSVSNLKHLTEPQVSTTVPALLASIENGLNSHGSLVAELVSTVEKSPLKQCLSGTIKQLESEAQTDDSETELVFSGLFRLCGSADDKAKAKKLRENRCVASEEKVLILGLGETLASQVGKFAPMRSGQSKLQSKLIKDAGKMRDGVDDVDLMTEDLLNKASREVANSILPDDNKAREALDSVRKQLEAVNEKSPTNIPDCVDRIIKRLESWEKLERLRRELREKASKEINRLRGEIQDKLNDLATAKATLEGQKTQYEAQIVLLQNTADLNASLVEKLTQEAVEKEKALSALKNSLAEIKNSHEELKEDNEKLQDEVDSNSKELRNLRRINKEKEAQIRDLTNNLEHYERGAEKTSLGDKEKSEILEKMKNDNKILKDELSEKAKTLDDLEEKLASQERLAKKLDMEKVTLENELEKLKAEKHQIKAELMKVSTEKVEIEERARMGEGTNPEEVKQLERILEDKQKELDECNSNLIVARRYQLLYPELTAEKQEIENKLREATIDSEDHKRKLEDAKSENEKLKFKLSTFDALQKDLQDQNKENQKLKLRLNFLEQSSGVSKDTADLAKKFSDDLGNKDNQIKDLLDEIAKLKQELAGKIEKYNVSLSRSFLVRLCHVFKEMQGQGFRKWRVAKPELGPVIDFSSGQKVAAIPISEEEAKFTDDYIAADKAIEEDNNQLLNSNPIVSSYKSLDSKAEKPMSYMNVFKFLEGLMDKKFEADKQDSNDGKALMPMPTFMMDTLVKSFGIQSLALKFLGQFIPGFHQIVKDGHQYGVFFARLLQMFHPDPVPLGLAAYLVRARMDFHPLIEKYERSQSEVGRDTKKKGDTYGRSAYEAAGTGGLAFVGDAMELIYQLFRGDREGGEKALELIKPSNVTIEDYVAYKICHKMARLGKTPEMIFSLIDKDQGGTIDIQEFITGTKEDLDLWISDENVTKLLKHLDTNNTREISKEAFMAKINMKFLIECNKNPVWVVSKATFLIALLEVFKFKERKMAAHLHPKCASCGSELSKDVFSGIINQYDPNLEAENVSKLFEEARSPDKKVIFTGTIRVIAKYGFGDLKAFKIREFMLELSKRKLEVYITENESTSVSFKKSQTSFIVGDTRIDREEEEKLVVRKKVVKKLVKRGPPS